jgi:(p)ppGpp synthase/HD superfamily hydrolase
MVQKRGGSPEVVAAAVLHDTLEDTDTTVEELQKRFGPTVASLVSELTDEYTKTAYPHLNRSQRKTLEAGRLAEASQSAKLIKLCDLIDNTRSIVEHDPDFATVYLREKAAVLEAMGYGENE